MKRRVKRKSKTIHIEYFRSYQEVLKHDEIIDINIDLIFQTFLKCIARLRTKKDLLNPPSQEDIDLIKNSILDILSTCEEYRH